MLSPILPVWLIRTAVRRHFTRTISYLIYENLSRLAAQWEESINSALDGVEREVHRRLEELLSSVERLLANAGGDLAPQLRADLERLQTLRERVQTWRKSLAGN